MRIVGLLPLPPYDIFATNAKITFKENTPFSMNDQRIGQLISAQPTEDRESIEVVVELDEGMEMPLMWGVALGGDNGFV
jgi:hypothetical protein